MRIKLIHNTQDCISQNSSAVYWSYLFLEVLYSTLRMGLHDSFLPSLWVLPEKKRLNGEFSLFHLNLSYVYVHNFLIKNYFPQCEHVHLYITTELKSKTPNIAANIAAKIENESLIPVISNLHTHTHTHAHTHCGPTHWIILHNEHTWWGVCLLTTSELYFTNRWWVMAEGVFNCLWVYFLG